MAKPREFTVQARKDILGLKDGSTRSAILVSGIYLQTRLTTLVMRGLGIKGKAGMTKFRGMFDDLTLGRLVNLAIEAKMLMPNEPYLLRTFVELRNDVAHDLEMWDKLGTKKRPAMKKWCDFAIRFMEETDWRDEEIRQEKPPNKSGKTNASNGESPNWLSKQALGIVDAYTGL